MKAAQDSGDARNGAELFASARYACVSCHKVGEHGGTVGPELSRVAATIPLREIAESLLWPQRAVKDGYMSVAVATSDGRTRQGYVVSNDGNELVLRDPTQGTTEAIAASEIEDQRQAGSLMPEGLLQAMAPAERADVLRFLIDVAKPGSEALVQIVSEAHGPQPFAYERGPLEPGDWPGWQLHVNRERVYDFYAKEARYFASARPRPRLVPEYPGLDGGIQGHWGNQSDDTWSDDRWNRTELGSLLSGVFRGGDVTVPKAVCVRLGDHNELSACFNPETLQYEAVWEGGFVRFAPKRHGLLDGLIMDGKLLARPEPRHFEGEHEYLGFYRHGRRVIFAYRVGGVEYLDAPWVEKGVFTRTVAPRGEHPLRGLVSGGPAQWPGVLETRLIRGQGQPFAIDTIEPPFENPTNSLMFFGGLDFLPGGDALVVTVPGELWRVSGLDQREGKTAWRRVASGFHQALGLVVKDDVVFVLGRDQITRLHDLNQDGEYDFYENVCNRYTTSPAGHDFICGLERDEQGRFYTASGPQGLLQISADGKSVKTLATGFRNPDGLGLAPDGTLTVPGSEGEWTSTSMISEIREGGHYGYTGPRSLDAPPDLPLVYLPRGEDNSASGQVFVDDARLGPLQGRFVHLSFGAGTAFLVLRDVVAGQPQGAVVPLRWEFESGVHRGRVRRQDGALYVAGMTGWGTYTPADGCLQRVRFTGGSDSVMPTGWHAHENGIRIELSAPLPQGGPLEETQVFVQAWNYRYGPAYGSPELSPSHPGTPGHDVLAVKSVTVDPDRKGLFLEIPDLQPVNQVQVYLMPQGMRPIELFATVHRLGPAFTQIPGYRAEKKIIAAHPIEADMVALRNPPPPNPWANSKPVSRTLTIEAGKNLSFSPRTLRAAAGEDVRLTFLNPDVVPHNWALLAPGTLDEVGDLLNRIISEPDAAQRQYIPRTSKVLVYTDIVSPHAQASIYFRAPAEPGRYPFVCSFPGHWKVMNGELIVE